MPYGSFNGIAAVALPFLLRRYGLPIERIASIGALVQAPAIWYVLWAPVVDLALRRRTWIVLLSVSSGLAAATALYLTTINALRMATALFVSASVLAQPVSSALGGLIASVAPTEKRGEIAGWSQTGTLAAGVLAGGTAIWLTEYSTPATVAAVSGLLLAAPSLAALFVPEPLPVRSDGTAHIARMWRELARAVRRRDMWLGILFFLSPVGAGALMNLFAGVAPDFHATVSVVILVVALGGAMTAVGALAGAYLLDRVDRWRSYPIAGLLTSFVTAILFFARLVPGAYVLGAAGYALVTGFAYANFMALALDLIGEDQAASGTMFTVLTAAVNLPVLYMLRLDGFGAQRFGVRGMLASDAIANGLFSIVLLVILLLFRRRSSTSALSSMRRQPVPE